MGKLFTKLRHVARQHLHMTIAKNQNQVVIYVMLIQMELKAIAGELVHLRKSCKSGSWYKSSTITSPEKCKVPTTTTTYSITFYPKHL